MKHLNLIYPILIYLITLFPLILAQQPYIRQSATECGTADNTTSVLGYICNGLNLNCQAYLTFHSNPPYNSVSTISTLLSVNSTQLAQLNSVQESSVFETNRVVLVPITCSCAGQYYQTNTTYSVRQNDAFFTIANNTFQGLSTCQAIQAQNRLSSTNLFPGNRVTVPLRCACPTRNQVNNGVNYLLSYLVNSGQYVSTISPLFNADTGATLAANGLSEQDANIFPFTTLLVPLQDPPTSFGVNAPQPPPPPPVTRPSPVTPTSSGSSRTWIYVVVGVIGGLVFVSVIVVVIFCVKRKNKRESDLSTEKFESVEKPLQGKEEDEESQDFLDSLSSIAHSLKVYTFKELRNATDNFSASFLIKGSVYRGTINGDPAAIKKMNGDVSKEINLLNKINHFNLIRLSGVCFNEGNWYLVYEYASNGPLSDWIHNYQQKILSWNQRLQIALDVATGLNYLHIYTSPAHVHKDLNSSNVLIDKDFRAKIANFGLARSAEGQEGHFALTRHIVGTQGYMAPEYLENGIVSPKLDVYAFGILLLEILTGKGVHLLNEEINALLSQVNDENGLENVHRLMDPLLEGHYPPELAVLLFKLIDNCLNKNPARRPNMDEIFQSLSRISDTTLSGEWQINISGNHTTPR